MSDGKIYNFPHDFFKKRKGITLDRHNNIYVEGKKSARASMMSSAAKGKRSKSNVRDSSKDFNPLKRTDPVYDELRNNLNKKDQLMVDESQDEEES